MSEQVEALLYWAIAVVIVLSLAYCFERNK